MDAITVIKDLFSRGEETIDLVESISDKVLNASPTPSIAWQLWRMGRSVDYNISPLLNRGQLWIDGGWHQQFGMAADPKDFQPGFPPPGEIVSTFTAPQGTLLADYLRSSLDLVREYLFTLNSVELDKEIDTGRFADPVTVGIRLVSVGVSLCQSAGAIRYRLWVA